MLVRHQRDADAGGREDDANSDEDWTDTVNEYSEYVPNQCVFDSSNRALGRGVVQFANQRPARQTRLHEARTAAEATRGGRRRCGEHIT